MSAFFSNLIFLNPWLLAALAALPALWFLLRLMPPAPKRVFLPSAAFLAGLIPAQKTPSHTPWWILLMRLLIAALVILAFAQPVLNPSNTLTGSSKIRLVIENGWGAASLWDIQIETARDLLNQAEREKREVLIATTAPVAGQKEPALFGPMSALEAQTVIGGLAPLPWPSDYKELQRLVEEQDAEGVDTYWLSNGIDGEGLKDLAQIFAQQGSVKFYVPEDEALPMALDFDEKALGTQSFKIKTPRNIPDGLPLTIQALGENGRVSGLQSVTLTPDTRNAPVTLDIPDVLRGDIRQIKIAERESAGSILLLGDRFSKKNVGIVSPVDEAEAKPFIEASYYLSRALEPYANVRTGTMDEVLSNQISMLVLPDIGAISPTTLNRLEEWVRDGGLLLRFGGPTMSQVQGENFLIPVPLRSGMRAMDGALTWENPPKLAPFAQSSPFYGLSLHEDITVRQQLLAQPSEDLPQKTWASLDDGTPLITAAPLDDGMLVMVHTTASPDWSDLPLSGLFVQLLSRIVKLAGAAPESLEDVSGVLQPIFVLDGFGRMIEPDSRVRAIPAVDFETTRISSVNPPGVYGRGAVSEVLNLGPQVEALRPLPDLPVGVTRQTYGERYEKDLMPSLLTAAVALLLLDWMVMLLLSLNLRWSFKRGFMVLAVLCFAPHTAMADIESDMRYADGLYLAYFKSQDASINMLSETGLKALSEELEHRTSAEPEGVVGLSPETDVLSFFPLIYWPVSAADSALSEKAIANIQSYLDHGGTILIDARNPNNDTQFLQKIMGALNIPPLAPIAKDHVLSRSFYLLNAFPGRYQGGTLWVESASAAGRDGVSSVIIGSHDWAGAWAESTGQYYRSGAQSRQRELAMRFGINAMMYALTGNYKADQVHVESILERLGQ